MRFGRLGMSNEHGSELTALVMPMRVEIFNASGFFAVHSDDFATQIDFSNLILNDQLSTPTASTVTVVNSTASGGVFDVNFSSPGAGVDGDIDVTPLLGAAGANLEWLQYDWNTGTNTFDENPTAKATFGIYKGNSHQIFSKQAFQ
jgi:MSHA biogenesis protein MshQ